MKFIRENSFVLVLVVAVAVLGGILVAVNMSLGDTITAETGKRTQLASRLRGFAEPGNLVNRAIVDAEASRVNRIVTEANSIVTQQLRKNQVPYKILSLPVIEERQVKQMWPAFPYDPNMYRDYGLALQFITIHRSETANRFGVLQQTHTPTEADIDQELRSLSGETGAVAAAAAPVSGGTGGTTVPFRQKATDYAVYDQAANGRIYVDPGVAAEVTFPEGTSVADDATLWRKQYKLWIATDIIAAIKAANDEVLNRVPRQDRTVSNAAVKRWVSLAIADAYSMKAGEAVAGSTAATPTAAPGGETGMPMMGGGGAPTRAPGAGGGAGAPTRAPGGPAAGGGGGAPAPSAPGRLAMPTLGPLSPVEETFTNRYTDPDKDVLQFRFQVVMPTRLIPVLLEKLTGGQVRTVLGCAIDEAPADPLFFYGNEPVALVTFTCEAIFLTNWERDLIPPGFLKTLPASALRDTDKQRIQ